MSDVSPNDDSLRVKIATLAVGDCVSVSQRLNLMTGDGAKRNVAVDQLRSKLKAPTFRAKQDTGHEFTTETGDFTTRSGDAMIVTAVVTRIN